MNPIRKGLAVAVIILLPVLSSADTSALDDDVDFTISAGFNEKDIGLGVTIDMMNNKTDNITVFINMSFDLIFLNFRDTTLSYNYILESKMWLHFGFGLGISKFSINVRGGNTTVTREGISIAKLLILFK